MSAADASWPGNHSDSDSAEVVNRKRSSRACDQCRKTKSKCRRGDDDLRPCESCAASGVACTSIGPSYKRGPPKGYIQAIEQRLRQVESVLGTIIGSADIRAQGLVKDLRSDHLAREIIDRVDQGPFGPTGRQHQHQSLSKEAFLNAITRSNDAASHVDRRSQRESRVNRENVSFSQDAIEIPTLEWQNSLSQRIGGSDHSTSVSSTYSDSTPSRNSPASVSDETSRQPAQQRRRLDDGFSRSPNFEGSLTMNHATEPDRQFEDGDDVEALDAAAGVGQLSLDENDQIRFHSEVSGIPLLDRVSERSDQRNEGGIWRLPMARTWPLAKGDLSNLRSMREDVDVDMPIQEHQDYLVELYFTYVHPVLPVLHKESFMEEYQSSKESVNYMGIQTPRSPPLPLDRRKSLRLLLLAMFTVSSRYNSAEQPIPAPGKMWEAGCDYLGSVRRILNTTFHRSCIPTCQALLILAYREGGVGSLEQGWLFLGMAIRMAQDLGLHRAADRWQRFGVDIFTTAQKQERKQVWWACCIADKYMSIYLGRPVAISQRDFDTELPQDDPQGRGKCFVETAPECAPKGILRTCAAVIKGCIVDKIYAVHKKPYSSRVRRLRELETRLEQWYLDLPEGLRFSPTSKKPVPPPHVLTLHIQYWCTVLLLHRKFIPHKKGWVERARSGDTSNQNIFRSSSSGGESIPLEHGPETMSLKAFDVCHSAATQLTTIVSVFSKTFCLKRTSAFLPAYLFSAGVMHIATLSLEKSEVQARLGLQQILAALKEMEIVWPSATRAWELLNGAKVRFEDAITPLERGPYRPKRDAQNAFGDEEEQQHTRNIADGNEAVSLGLRSWTRPTQPEIGTVLMPQMLGLDIPGIDPIYQQSGQECWPRAHVSHMTEPGVSEGPDMTNLPTGFTPNTYVAGLFIPPGTASISDAWLQDLAGGHDAVFGSFDFQSFTDPEHA